jgi:hypothetical protein
MAASDRRILDILSIPLPDKEICFYVFSNGPGDLKHLGSAGRQADEYIAPRGRFFRGLLYGTDLISPNSIFDY